jgi:integration host factor subunit alpha
MKVASPSGERGARTLTKADLIERVRLETGLPRTEAAELLESVLETVKATLEEGENVKVSGFGSFVVRQKSARQGRNPKTAEAITLPRRRVLTFKPSNVLRSAINQDE